MPLARRRPSVRRLWMPRPLRIALHLRCGQNRLRPTSPMPFPPTMQHSLPLPQTKRYPRPALQRRCSPRHLPPWTMHHPPRMLLPRRPRPHLACHAPNPCDHPLWQTPQNPLPSQTRKTPRRHLHLPRQGQMPVRRGRMQESTPSLSPWRSGTLSSTCREQPCSRAMVSSCDAPFPLVRKRYQGSLYATKLVAYLLTL